MQAHIAQVKGVLQYDGYRRQVSDIFVNFSKTPTYPGDMDW